MIPRITHILQEKYGIESNPGQKIECPFCHHHSFSIKKDDSIGKCFHPTCGKVIKADTTDEGYMNPSEIAATMQPHTGCTLSEYANEKKLPIDFLKEIGLQQIHLSGCPAIRIPYFDKNKIECSVRFRLALKKTDADVRFKWRKESKPQPYGLWKLDMAIEQRYLVLVEGESDSQTLWFHNIPAIGIPGANSWKEEWVSYLDDIPKIFVIIEPDSGGNAICKWLDKSRIREKAVLVSLSTYKDPSGLYLADPDNFIKNWKEFIDIGIPFQVYSLNQKRQKADELWSKCQSLATDPAILDSFISTLHNGMGVAGETRLAKILFLAVVSRFLDKPISLSVRGPSSCGKSYLVEKALEFFPSSAHYALTAMSDKTLAYSTEPLSHRFLVLYEYSGMQGEMASYLMRSFLSEGRIRYETVEKTKDGFKPRFIEREGPTGLIMTTTAVNIHPENETRILTIPITDSKEQTKAILLSLANKKSRKIDLSEWHSLHEWLESGIHEVDIPYAEALARNIQPSSVRLRRDFSQVLSLIKSHAILYQAQRSIKDGKIIAEIIDYTVVRELMNDLISDQIDATVPKSVRETVECVSRLLSEANTEVTIKDVAIKLQLDKSAAHRRVITAINKGYLRNLEGKKGRPARIVLGDAMPEDNAILPSPEILNGCTIAMNQEGDNTPPLISEPSAGLTEALNSSIISNINQTANFANRLISNI